ncbi:MAG: CsbD family protein [Synechococcus sp.]
MALNDSIQAAAKAAEGRLQAAAGELTGNNTLKAEGEAKQVQAHVIEAAGTLKDKVQAAADTVRQALD